LRSAWRFSSGDAVCHLAFYVILGDGEMQEGQVWEAALEAGVVNMSTLKPLDEALVASCGRETGLVVVAENHSIVGGLGSAVAESLLEAGIQVRFARVGIADRFAEGDRLLICRRNTDWMRQQSWRLFDGSRRAGKWLSVGPPLDLRAGRPHFGANWQWVSRDERRLASRLRRRRAISFTRPPVRRLA
jgi:Transketolase, C-terminal domain